MLGARMPPMSGIGGLATAAGLGMTLELGDAPFIIDIDIGVAAAGGGGVAIVLVLALVLPIFGGREGLVDAVLGRGGARLFVAMLPIAGMVAPGRAEIPLKPELGRLFVDELLAAMLLDKKVCTCCNCSAESESSCSSIFSKEGSRGSRWRLSVCFSFPHGSMIV